MPRRFFGLDAIQNIRESYVRITEDDQLGAPILTLLCDQMVHLCDQGVPLTKLRNSIFLE
jgi:hypothetical protein